MDRRRFLVTSLAGVLAAPLAVEAQLAGEVARIGVLQSAQNENLVAFVQALRDAGYVDGRSAVIKTRLYGPTPERLPQLANELVASKCDVILAAGPYAIRAATGATSATPIVGIDLESDPMANGWVRSLGHPGGNVTGLFLDAPELGGKQIQLLKEAVPTLSHIAIVWDSSVGEVQFHATDAAARALGVTVQSIPIQRSRDFEDGLNRTARQHLNGIIVLSSPLIFRERVQIASVALKNRLPTISLFTLFAESGGLMAYGLICQRCTGAQ
jgi:ABC-type uncharacterized transport system substrate-binding protein